MLCDFSDETISIEDRGIIVNVTRHDPDLCVPGQRRLTRADLVVSEDVEVPHGSSPRVVAVETSREEYLARSPVDPERSVGGELTRQTVADVGVAVSVRIDRSHLGEGDREEYWNGLMLSCRLFII